MDLNLSTPGNSWLVLLGKPGGDRHHNSMGDTGPHPHECELHSVSVELGSFARWKLSVRLQEPDFGFRHHQLRAGFGSSDPAAENHMGIKPVDNQEVGCIYHLPGWSSVSRSGLTTQALVLLLTRDNRGIAAACIRLVCVVTYRTAHDDTYNFSIVGLTSIAEVTCAILILCFPSTPKAMQTLGLLKVFTPLKTVWSTKSTSNTSGDTVLSWPRPDGRKRNTGSYAQVDESGVPLSPVRTSRIPQTASSSPITRVTSFTATSDYTSDPGCDEYERQHPWIVRKA